MAKVYNDSIEICQIFWDYANDDISTDFLPSQKSKSHYQIDYGAKASRRFCECETSTISIYLSMSVCVFACMYMCEQFNKIRFHKENSEKEREFQRKMCSPHQMCLEKVFCSLFGFQLAQYKRNNQNTWAKRRKQKLNYLQAKGSASKIMVRKDLCDACTLDCYAEI